MATIAGKVSTFTLDDAGDVVRDIGPYITAAEMDVSIDELDDTAFGDTWRTALMGLRGATLSVTGHYDTTANVGADTVFGDLLTDTSWTSADFVFSPDGGTISYSGACILTSYNISSDVEGKVVITGNLRVTGALARA